jgi:hypothetical protein
MKHFKFYWDLLNDDEYRFNIKAFNTKGNMDLAHVQFIGVYLYLFKKVIRLAIGISHSPIP